MDNVSTLRALLKRVKLGQAPAPHPRTVAPPQPRVRRTKDELYKRKMRRELARQEAEEAKKKADDEVRSGVSGASALPRVFTVTVILRLCASVS